MMSSHVAAELLRSYAAAGTRLEDCLGLALEATQDNPEQRQRVKNAAIILELVRG